MFLAIKQVEGLTKNSEVVRLIVGVYFREVLPRKLRQ